MSDGPMLEINQSARHLAELAKRPGELPMMAIKRLGAAAGLLMQHAPADQRARIKAVLIEQVDITCGDG